MNKNLKKYKTVGPQLHLSDPLTWPTTTAPKQNKRKKFTRQLFSAQAVDVSSPFWGCIFPFCCCCFFCLFCAWTYLCMYVRGVCNVRSRCMHWTLKICTAKQCVSAYGLCGLGALSIHYYYCCLSWHLSSVVRSKKWSRIAPWLCCVCWWCPWGVWSPLWLPAG